MNILPSSKNVHKGSRGNSFSNPDVDFHDQEDDMGSFNYLEE